MNLIEYSVLQVCDASLFLFALFPFLWFAVHCARDCSIRGSYTKQLCALIVMYMYMYTCTSILGGMLDISHRPLTTLATPAGP